MADPRSFHALAPESEISIFSTSGEPDTDFERSGVEWSDDGLDRSLLFHLVALTFGFILAPNATLSRSGAVDWTFRSSSMSVSRFLQEPSSLHQPRPSYVSITLGRPSWARRRCTTSSLLEDRKYFPFAPGGNRVCGVHRIPLKSRAVDFHWRKSIRGDTAPEFYLHSGRKRPRSQGER